MQNLFIFIFIFFQMANQAERILESDERKSITSFKNQGNKENSNIPAYPFIGTCTGGVRFKETRTHKAKAPCILLIIVYSAGWSALATSAFRFPISMFSAQLCADTSYLPG